MVDIVADIDVECIFITNISTVLYRTSCLPSIHRSLGVYRIGFWCSCCMLMVAPS